MDADLQAAQELLIAKRRELGLDDHGRRPPEPPIPTLGEVLKEAVAKLATSTPCRSSQELTSVCDTCGDTILPVEFELLPGQIRRVPGHCSVCEPKRLAAEAEEERQTEIKKRQEPYRKHFPFRDKRYVDANLDTAEDWPGTKLAMQYARRFALNLPKPDPIGLLIYGPKGNGKTHMVAGIAHQAEVAGLTVAWINGKEWLRSIGSMEAGEREEQIRLACRADLLIIDDLGADRMTGPRAGWLFTVVDAFYRKNKPTAFTTNYNPGELPGRLTPEKRDGEDSDCLDGERIMDRIAEMCVRFIPNEAPSYRMEMARRKALEAEMNEKGEVS